MSWARRDSEFHAAVGDQFTFDPAESLTYMIWKSPPSSPLQLSNKNVKPPNYITKFLSDDYEWDIWLRENKLGDVIEGESRVNLLLAGRREDSELSDLPFRANTFFRIAQKWAAHSSIMRIINRNKSCYFGRLPYEWNDGYWRGKSFVYNCRTTDTWAKDMALSVTYFPKTSITNAIWYGCDLRKKEVHDRGLSDADFITKRLKDFDGDVLHPMMLPTVFAELERDRLVNLSRDNVNELVRRLDMLVSSTHLGADDPDNIRYENYTSTSLVSRNGAPVQPSCSNRSSNVADIELVALNAPSANAQQTNDIKRESTIFVWLRLSYIRNGLNSWREQVAKMLEHMKELETTKYGLESQPSNSLELRNSRMQSCGERITGRLQELLAECDEAARDCTRAMEGMSLASQLEMNIIGRKDALMNQRISENSLQLARLAKRDAEIMKPVAVLGMTFLPGMFISAFFSIGFFDYTEDTSLSASQWICIWVVSTVVSTILTINVFHILTARRLRGVKARNNVETYADIS